MTITRMIGSGLVGGNLARAAIAYGYDIVISNARGTADTHRHASGTRAESLGRHRSSRGRVGDFAIVAIPPLASCRVPSHAAAAATAVMIGERIADLITTNAG